MVWAEFVRRVGATQPGGALELVVRERPEGRGLWLEQLPDVLQPGDRVHLFLGTHQIAPGGAIEGPDGGPQGGNAPDAP